MSSRVNGKLKESLLQPELCGSVVEGLTQRFGLRDSGVMDFQSLFLQFVRGQMNVCSPPLYGLLSRCDRRPEG